MKPQDDDEIQPDTLATWWFGAPAVGNALSIVPWLRLLFLSPGTTYDAPGPLIVVLFIGSGTLLISLAVGAVLIRKRRRVQALCCLLLGLTPVVVGLGAGYLISSWKGITVPLFRDLP